MEALFHYKRDSKNIIDKAAFTSTVNQYITFMETKGRKAPKWGKIYSSNNKQWQLSA